MLSKEEEEKNVFINDYETRREQERQQDEKNLQAILEALKPLVASNLLYFKYAKAKGWFTIAGEEAEETALHNTLITVSGRSIKWSVRQARKLAYEILEEVNDHSTASKVAELEEFKAVLGK